MEAEYATRRQQLLEECQVAPETFAQVMARLDALIGFRGLMLPRYPRSVTHF
jgi:hypothetical protein